jgi:hypothetical protein
MSFEGKLVKDSVALAVKEFHEVKVWVFGKVVVKLVDLAVEEEQIDHIALLPA